MKGLTKYSTGFLFPLLLAVTLIPKPQADPVYPKETVIFYSNGMLTIERVAQYNRTALERHLKQNVLNQLSNFSSDELTFELAYNHSFGQNVAGGIDDLHEAIAEQLSENSISVFWRNINLLEDSGNPISTAIAIILRDLFADLVVEYEGTSTLDQQLAIQQHVDTFNQLLKECKRLILFGHSQGAIVSNIAHTGIEPTLESAIAAMGVGTPDSYVAGEGNFYTNLEEDLLVQSIPGALPGNVDNYDPFTSVPGVGHALIGNYIDLYSPLPSEEKIVDDLIAMIEQVQSFDNIDYCGWPAIYARGVDVYFDPANFETSEEAAQEQWNYLWQAAVSGDLIIEFSPIGASNWTTLKNYGPRTDRWVEYNYNNPMPFDPDYESAPFIFINNNYLSGGYDFSRTVEIQIDDDNPADEYRYRFIIDNKVVDQIRILQHPGIWNEVYTSNPIDAPLPSGSLPIFPLP